MWRKKHVSTYGALNVSDKLHKRAVEVRQKMLVNICIKFVSPFFCKIIAHKCMQFLNICMYVVYKQVVYIYIYV